MGNKNCNGEKFVIDKEFSVMLKGIAIILMLIHHLYGYPEWWGESIDYSDLPIMTIVVARCCKICVGIFAFLTGWVYFFHEDKSYKYSIKKITYFLIEYWVAYIIFSIMAGIIGGYKPTLIEIITGLVGVNSPLMVFCWYVCFYVVVMLVLPTINRIIKRFNINTFFKEFLCTFVIWCFLWIVIVVSNSKALIEGIFGFFPAILCGYFCAKYCILDKLVQSVKSQGYRLIVGIILIVGSIFIFACKPIDYAIFNICFITPLMHIAGVYLINIDKLKIVNKVLFTLGKYSMNIWYAQCIVFAECTKNIIQPIIYFPHNPILVVIWMIICCLMVAYVLYKIQKLILGLLERKTKLQGVF